MNKHQSSYRQIMKATSLFGGVQVFQIIISIVRSKFVALLLGPAGMGIVGLLTSTTGLVAGLTNFGLGTSAIKNISEANATGDEQRVATVIAVMRRLVWITGILGTVITLIFAPWLSHFTFGDRSYTAAFVWISATLLFSQLSTGELVLLQGLRKLQDLAKANVYGSLAGLAITIPLYYRFGVKGIVPVIILTAVSTLFFSWYFAAKTRIGKVDLNREITITEGKSMMVMGFMISLSGLISIAVAYLLRIFINRTGNTADVGLYNAGFAIINTYVGMIFTAMGTDYYPRLSAVANSNELCSRNVNQQSEIALLILAPVLIGFLVFIHWAIILLYSTQFLDITGMIYWASLGIFFKAVSWAIAFVFLAKGKQALFLERIGRKHLYTGIQSAWISPGRINGTGHCISGGLHDLYGTGIYYCEDEVPVFIHHLLYKDLCDPVNAGIDKFCSGKPDRKAFGIPHRNSAHRFFVLVFVRGTGKQDRFKRDCSRFYSKR